MGPAGACKAAGSLAALECGMHGPLLANARWATCIRACASTPAPPSTSPHQLPASATTPLQGTIADVVSGAPVGVFDSQNLVTPEGTAPGAPSEVMQDTVFELGPQGGCCAVPVGRVCSAP